MYLYRFVDYEDSGSSPLPNPRYLSHFPISSLLASDARLIQLGTLFGSSRLHLRSPAHRAIRKAIRESMVLSNTVLQSASSAAGRQLGGSYLGAHIRVGDGPFYTSRAQNIRAIWYKLVTQTLNISLSKAQHLERRFSSWQPPAELPTLPAAHSSRSTDPMDPTPATRRKLPCRRPAHTASELHSLNIPLFVSTDSPAERHLELLTRTFPCTFFLGDVLPPSPLDDAVSSHDEVPLKPFLLPMVDALVVAGARGFVGTDGSTFSTYVEDVLWRKLHGLDILQRG
ncbi:hypothetical protein FA95DRAFT_1560769 [Auriscalpium vulgare]|uniref:Uncharacterized protein n=1 Tax=Auriscalpium vulgare TaxID=40419 RepID=A0ACB8RNH7_9AGAM|nr:hypothetical protein FA95DRAFT_1560769 [Auriscalpium vulgare]